MIEAGIVEVQVLHAHDLTLGRVLDHGHVDADRELHPRVNTHAQDQNPSHTLVHQVITVK